MRSDAGITGSKSEPEFEDEQDLQGLLFGTDLYFLHAFSFPAVPLVFVSPGRGRAGLHAGSAARGLRLGQSGPSDD